MPPLDPRETTRSVSGVKELGDAYWEAHLALHAAAEKVALRAAADVKEALDKAAIEVTGRLTEVRAYIDQVLKSHADLHGADREALILARDGIAKELREINNVREQIAAERSQYPTGDAVRSLIGAARQEALAALTAHQVDERQEVSVLRETAKDNAARISKLENDVKDASNTRDAVKDNQTRIHALEISWSNLNGRLAAYGAGLVILIGVLEFLTRNVKIGG